MTIEERLSALKELAIDNGLTVIAVGDTFIRVEYECSSFEHGTWTATAYCFNRRDVLSCV